LNQIEFRGMGLIGNKIPIRFRYYYGFNALSVHVNQVNLVDFGEIVHILTNEVASFTKGQNLLLIPTIKFNTQLFQHI
jgi:hypothetical protein